MSTPTNTWTRLSCVSFAAAFLLGSAVEVQAQFHFGEPENLGPVVNTQYKEGGPCITADGLTLIFSSSRPPGSDSRGDLWVTTRLSASDPWETPMSLGSPVNTDYGDWAPSISSDGLILVIDSSRPGGEGDRDIWITTRATLEDPWQTPMNLGPVVNSSFLEGSPDISANGLTMLYFSDRPGGLGDFDIWMTTRASLADPWQAPVNLGASINSPYFDANPSASPDGLTLFFNSSHPVDAGIWTTTRARVSDPWEPPVFLPSSINSAWVDGGPAFWAGGSTLFFVSNRPGGYGSNDLYQVAVFPCHGDLNRDGEVGLADLTLLLAHFGITSGMTYGDGDLDGDGDVDLTDLSEFLSRYGRPCP